MSILLNDNLNVAAPRPVDSRFGPYADINAALTAIPSAKRYQGLVVGILAAGVVIEYWFKNGTDNADLILKTAGSLTTEEFIAMGLFGQPNGVAKLGADGKLVSSELPQINTTNIACLTTSPTAGLVPQLDATGKISIAQIPQSLIGGLNYQGHWNASTNTSPTLTSGVGTKGYYYVVDVAGTTSLDGHSDWLAGDLVIYDGTAWDKIPGNDAQIIEINGQGPVAGKVTLTPSHIGAVSTAQLTTLKTSSGVPQLTTEGLLSLQQLSIASTTGLGVMQVSTTAGINITTAGILSLQPATTSQLGGVIAGANLTIDSDGKIHAQNSYVLPAATTSTLGGVIVGSNINLDTTGLISLNKASTSTLGVVQISTAAGMSITTEGILSLTAATTAGIGGIYATTASGLTLQQAGQLSLSAATTAGIGGLIVGTGLSVDGNGTVSVASLPNNYVVDGGTY